MSDIYMQDDMPQTGETGDDAGDMGGEEKTETPADSDEQV